MSLNLNMISDFHLRPTRASGIRARARSTADHKVQAEGRAGVPPGVHERGRDRARRRRGSRGADADLSLARDRTHRAGSVRLTIYFFL